jgi:hypothetical protein
VSQSRGGKQAQQRRKRPQKPKPKPAFWRAVPELGDPEPIVPAVDPTALLRSLGAPPLQGQGAAEHYMASVVERAAQVAVALAASAGMLADADRG